MSKPHTLQPKYRAAGLIGAGLLVFLTGCNLLPFVSNEERIQISYVRSFKKGLSPTDNKAFGIMLREVGKLLGYNLPTRYGIDISPYLMPFPSVEPISPTVSLAPPDKDQSTGELRTIRDQANQLSISFTSAPDNTQQTYVYTAAVNQTPTGTTGKYEFQTSGTNWLPVQSTGGYVLGLNKAPKVANSMVLKAQFALPQSAGAATMRVDLGFDQGGGGTAPVPRNASVTFQLQNNLAANLTGSYGSLQSTVLNGTVSVKGDKSTETYQADIRASSGNAEMVLINDQRKLRFELKYEDGLLSGLIKATDGRQAELAKIVQEAGKAPEIQYADGTKETWNFTLPSS